MAHPQVREYLDVKRGRASGSGVVALEGLWALQRALEAGVELQTVFVCADRLRRAAPGTADGLLTELATRGTQFVEVGERVLARMVDRDGPDGVAALARLRPSRLEDLPAGPTTRVIVADGVHLAGNIGTLIRCADGAGASAVVLADDRNRLGHPLVTKASMGAVLSIPVVVAPGPAVLASMRRRRFRIIAADPGAALSYRQADYRGPVAVVVGNERRGLDRRWLDEADARVGIPMLGSADSLNVALAGALLLYEALHHQRA